MAWPSNSSPGHTSHSFPRHKTAQIKLLERLRLENPVLNVVALPAQPVSCGKNKLKFPDPNNDSYVILSLNSQTSKLSLPVHYDFEEKEELEEEEDACRFVGHVNGLSYSLRLLSVTRYTLNGEKLSSESSEKSFYCCCPLTDRGKMYQDTNSDNGVFGFWFRLLSEDTRFHFTMALRLKGLDLLPKEYYKNDTYLCDLNCQDGIVCSVEFDICTTARQHETSGTDKKAKTTAIQRNSNGKAVVVSQLYSNEKYKKLIQSVHELKLEAKYDDLEQLLSHASARYQADYDLKVVVLLEQGSVASRKRFCDYAKDLFKNAVDLVGRCQNKSLLTGRIYIYLSEVHFNEGFIGNAGESLAVARKYLESFDLCEDLGDLCFCEGLILMVHAKRTQSFLKNLIPEAREKFLDAVKNYHSGESVCSMADKLNCTYVKLASLELQPMPDDDGKELIVTAEQVSKAQSYLETVQQDFKSLSQQTKLYYYLCSAELCLELKNVNEANENYKQALSLAETIGLRNYVHVDIALEEVRRCLENDLVVVETPLASEQQHNDETSRGQADNLDGYLGDESNEDS